jgi:hypothetical protein
MYDEDSSINGTKLRAYNQTVIITIGGAGSWADELHTAYNNKDKVKSAILSALPTMPSAGGNKTGGSSEAIISTAICLLGNALTVAPYTTHLSYNSPSWFHGLIFSYKAS